MLDSNDSNGTVLRRRILQSLGVAGAGLAGIGTAGGTPRCAPPGTEETGPRPGPALLHSPQPVGQAHAGTNGSGWTASPLLISGTEAYVDGEYIYQDYVYDDNGANTTNAPAPPNPEPNNDTFSPPTGDVVYPTDADTYGFNAADLLEFRARPDRGRVTYRIALQTMKDPSAAAVALGIDTGGGDGFDDWGHGIGSLGPLGLDYVVVAFHDGTRGRAAVKGGDPPVDASFHPASNQIEITLDVDPGRATWRHYVGTGLWDTEAGAFKQIQEQPSEHQPGGAHGRNPPPIFNVGFRFDEPAAAVNVDRGEFTSEVEEAAETPGTRGNGYGHWREHQQAKALANRDISSLHADVDFGYLADRVTSRRVPRTGLMYRLYGSTVSLGEGVGNEAAAEGISTDVFLNDVQPYTLYVPEGYDPSREHPLHVHLHGYTASLSESAAFYPDFLRQIGEERNALVLSPEGRGPGLSYTNAGELDVVEAMADVIHRYAIDFDRITISGYSMGGGGTFRLGALYPDLFAKGFPIVGAAETGTTAIVPDDVPGSETVEAAEGAGPTIIENLRNVPILMWNASNDELVPATSYLPTQQELQDLGYQHELDIFLGYDHFAFGIEDDWGRAKEFLEGDFLGDATVASAPAHVTYRRDLEEEPTFAGEDVDWDIAHDKAYWVSDIEVAPEAASGLVDVRSEASGEAPPTLVNIRGVGTDPNPHAKRGIRWDRTVEAVPERNRLDVQLEAVTGVTFWVDEAGVDPGEPLTLTVDSSTAATITLESAAGTETVAVAAGENTYTVLLCPRGAPGP